MPEQSFTNYYYLGGETVECLALVPTKNGRSSFITMMRKNKSNLSIIEFEEL